MNFKNYRKWDKLPDILYNVDGPAKILMLSQIFQYQTKDSFLIVSENAKCAQQLYQQVKLTNKAEDIFLFPDWETLPYEVLSPATEISSQRMAVLTRLLSYKPKAIIVTASSLLQPLPTKKYILQTGLAVKVGANINLTRFVTELCEAGYDEVEQVEIHGQFAKRGGTLDLMPSNSNYICRIEWFDDEIDRIIIIDPKSNSKISNETHYNILPASEYPFDKKSRQEFLANYKQLFATKGSVYKDVSLARPCLGLEYYLPLFFQNQKISLIDYLDSSTKIIQVGNINESLSKAYEEIYRRYEQLSVDDHRPILSPELLYHNVNDIQNTLKNFDYKTWLTAEATNQESNLATIADNLTTYKLNISKLKLAANNGLKKLQHYIDMNKVIIITAATSGELVALSRQLDRLNIQYSHYSDINQLNAFLYKPRSAQIIIFTCLLNDSWQFNENFLFIPFRIINKISSRNNTQQQKNNKSSELDINIGDFVVHSTHGIAQFQGFSKLDLGNNNEDDEEFLLLHFADNNKMYLPPTKAHMLYPYHSQDQNKVELAKLGGKKFQLEKKKAITQIQQQAEELLSIYAQRELAKGFSYKITDTYKAFAQEFRFTETQDQLTAIEATIEDLTSKKPMDRLICGDVGFGKTEVAMRAAFIVTQNKKQVCIVVPTTLLALQHYQNFQDRMANWPISISLLCRVNAKKHATIISEFNNNKTNILISTHKIFYQNINVNNLGLLIIDEEQRFGVKHKEFLKKKRSELDILTLSATPIPRTLHASLTKLRDISMITTPPKHRLPIKTKITFKDKTIIKNAINRELSRGGVIFYVHNDVASMEKEKSWLQEFMPDINIVCAHGQMPENKLEQIMLDMYHMQIEILICSTIIETGIDIPAANTIIINNAQNFGLANLYQLRGRVGRSHHQAFAYLQIPNTIPKHAKDRLEVLVTHQALGSGFMIASYDLEVRGSGSVLGSEQSGTTNKIGLSLYQEMLSKACHLLTTNQDLNLDASSDVEIKLKLINGLPESYINSLAQRMLYYKKLAQATQEEFLDCIIIELIDAYGPLPIPANNLIAIHQIRLIATRMKILSIKQIENKINIKLDKNPKINFNTLLQDVNKIHSNITIQSDRIIIMLTKKQIDDIATSIYNILDKYHLK